MSKYNVYLIATASCTVEVEAEDGDAAVEAAFDLSLPYADAFCGFELGDWSTASDVFPATCKPDADYELIEGGPLMLSESTPNSEERLHSAIGGVLFNVSNFPERAQARLLGQDMGPLRQKIADAVLAAGYRRQEGDVKEVDELASYMVVAKRPSMDGDGFDYASVGSIWNRVEPCENHQAYCQMAAEADPQRYGDVEYQIVRLSEWVPVTEEGGEQHDDD